MPASPPDKLCSDGHMQDSHQPNRRRNRRIKIGQSFLLRPTDPHIESFEEMGTTKNVSREGFYFLSQRQTYKEGMRLFVTLPFHSPADPGDHEYLGQVIRVELLGDGQRGVAIQLLSSVASPPTG